MEQNNQPQAIPLSHLDSRGVDQSNINSQVSLPNYFNNFTYHPYSYTNFPFHTYNPYGCNDDEPLPDPPTTTTLLNPGLENVVIETSTEFPAVAASDYNESFAVLLSLRAPPFPPVEAASKKQRQLLPVDLVAVLDVNLSMSGDKLSLLKSATKYVINHMLPYDRLSIISSTSKKLLPLRRMTEGGRKDAEIVVDRLEVEPCPNIVTGLNIGAKVLEQRSQCNPVSGIIFISDGGKYGDTQNADNCYGGNPSNYTLSQLLYSLSPSISSRSSQRSYGVNEIEERFPVYTFGIGMDHDAVVMNTIADGSNGGTFSFVESAEMIPKSFASCIGALFSVVAQEVRITVSSASAGVEIISIPSGRHENEIACRNKQGTIYVGDLFADEKKDFLIYLSVPIHTLASVDDHMATSKEETAISKTPLLNIVCYYCNAFTDEMVKIDGPIIEIMRPITLSPADSAVNLKVDKQQNCVAVSESIAKAKEMVVRGNLIGAKEVLTGSRDNVLESASAQADAEMVNWLEAELKEITEKMESMDSYGRIASMDFYDPYMYGGGMSALGAQSGATWNSGGGMSALGAQGGAMFGSSGGAGGAAYDTPMQSKVQRPLKPRVPIQMQKDTLAAQMQSMVQRPPTPLFSKTPLPRPPSMMAQTHSSFQMPPPPPMKTNLPPPKKIRHEGRS